MCYMKDFFPLQNKKYKRQLSQICGPKFISQFWLFSELYKKENSEKKNKNKKIKSRLSFLFFIIFSHVVETSFPIYV